MDRYTQELAGTVVGLFNSGVPDPSAEEIAENHFPERALGGEIVEGIRKRLVRVQRHVEDVYELPVCLVTQRYYAIYRETPPVTMKEAHSCIPGGRHNHSFGIRKQNGDGDLIWQATIERDLLSAAGKEKRVTDRVLAAVAGEDLSNENAVRLLQEMRTKALPERPEIAQQLFQAVETRLELEEGNGED
jgi:hypothetical protein